MMTFERVVIIFSLLICVLAIPPPSYIIPCHLKDPNFKKCLIEHSNSGFSSIYKGDKKYKFPPINPLHLSQVSIKQSNLEVNLTDVQVSGVERAKFVDIDINDNVMTLEAHADHIEVTGNYIIKGNIVLLNLSGHGKANLTVVDGIYKFITNLKTISKNGVDHLQMTDSKMTYKIGRAYFQFDDILKDEKLGIDANQLLNDNWEAVVEDIGGSITNVVSQIYNTIVSKLFDVVSKKDILPE